MACYAPVICSHCPPPTYGNVRGIAGLICGTVTFIVPPQCRGSAKLVLLHKYTPVEITIIKSGVMIIRRSPQCKAFRRGVTYEKSFSPLYPICGGYTPYVGAVVSNDWCITDKFLWNLMYVQILKHVTYFLEFFRFSNVCSHAMH